MLTNSRDPGPTICVWLGRPSAEIVRRVLKRDAEREFSFTSVGSLYGECVCVCVSVQLSWKIKVEVAKDCNCCKNCQKLKVRSSRRLEMGTVYYICSTGSGLKTGNFVVQIIALATL